MRFVLTVLALACLLGAAVVNRALAVDGASVAKPVLVELYTSQNCPACPKANQNIIELAEEGRIFPITFSVDYWDYLGWKDTHAEPEFALRQRAYADYFRLRGPYTPQTVIGGIDQVTGTAKARLETRVRESQPSNILQLVSSDDGRKISISATETMDRVDMWLIGYQPGITQIAPQSGDNAGMVMDHINLATSLEPLGKWSGTNHLVEAKCPAQACLIVAQNGKTGVVLGYSQITP